MIRQRGGLPTVGTSKIVSVASFQGPLDGHTASLVGAWSSARTLLSSYGTSAPLINVRRSSDNTASSFASKANGDLDQVSLLAFTGAGNGFIANLFDQSGGVQNLINATNASQPAIVSTGSVITGANGKPGPTFDGVSQVLKSTLASATSRTIYIVGKELSSQASPGNLLSITDTTRANLWGFANFAWAWNYNSGFGGQAIANLDPTAAFAVIALSFDASANCTPYVNNSAGSVFTAVNGAGSGGYNDGSGLYMGGTLTMANFGNCQIHELYVYNATHNAATVAAISAIMKSYYGTP